MILIYGDTRVERDETFDIILEITSSTAGITATVDNAKLQVTIKDDDKAEFSFVTDETTGAEGNKVTLEVMTDSVIEDIEIELTSNGMINSKAEQYNRAVAADYTKETGTLTFSDATRTGIVEYLIEQDDIVELAESFLITLSGDKVKTKKAATVSIAVDSSDTAELSFSQSTLSVTEGDTGTSTVTTVTLTAELTNLISAPISFNYATNNSSGANRASGSQGNQTTPVNPVDYITVSNGTAMISESTSTTITVRINSDNIVEADETFNVVLSRLILGSYKANQISLATGSSASAEVTITNDDKAVLSFSPVNDEREPTLSTDPDNNLVFEVTTGGVIADKNITVNFNTTNVTATAGENEDYIAVNDTVIIIPAGSTSATQIVKINGDDIVEGRETLSAEISSPMFGGSEYSFVTLGNNVTATGGIIDDDGINFDINVSEYITEGMADTTTGVKVTIKVDQPDRYTSSAGSITVNYKVALDRRELKELDATGRASESDFEATSGSLTFTSNNTSNSFTFNIIGDATVERNETLNLIFDIDGEGQFLLSESSKDATTIIAIQNDDTAVFTLTALPDATKEGNSRETDRVVNFTLNSASKIANNVTFSATVDATGGGTAIKGAGNDFTVGNTNITLASGDNFTGTLPISIIGDNIVEPNETIVVSAILTPTQTGVLARINNNLATATIDNDDRATLSITSNASAEEGSPITFTVSSNATIDRDITVNYTTANGTAIAGTDYTIPTSTVTLPAGEEATSIIVTTVNDNIVEGNETFIITLSGVDRKGIANGDISLRYFNKDQEQEQSINDDRATLSITQTVAPTSEGSPITFTVTSDYPIDRPINVNYTSAGTAEEGMNFDYTTDSFVTLQADSTTANITVNTLIDNIVEKQEIVIVNLTGISGLAGNQQQSAIADGDVSIDTNIVKRTGIGAINNVDTATLSIARKCIRCNRRLSYYINS